MCSTLLYRCPGRVQSYLPRFGTKTDPGWARDRNLLAWTRETAYVARGMLLRLPEDGQSPLRFKVALAFTFLGSMAVRTPGTWPDGLVRVMSHFPGYGGFRYVKHRRTPFWSDCHRTP